MLFFLNFDLIFFLCNTKDRNIYLLKLLKVKVEYMSSYFRISKFPPVVLDAVIQNLLDTIHRHRKIYFSTGAQLNENKICVGGCCFIYHVFQLYYNK